MAGFWTKYKQNYKSIAKLGLPILISQLGMIAVGFADNIMVGRYSTDALAASSFVISVFNIAIFACTGFAYGLTPLIGALFSQKRDNAIGSMVKNGLFINTLFTLIVTGIMCVVYACVDRLGQPEELLPLIRPYFIIFLVSIVPITVFNVFSQWAYAINRSSLPMWIILGGNLVNVLGNWLLIYGHWGCPEMGLVGAGLSTLLARVLCPVAIIIIFFTSKRFRGYKEGYRSSRVALQPIGHITRTSFPVSLQMTLEVGAFSGAGIMAGWLGALPLAAYQIIVVISTLGFCIYYSVSSSVAVFVSNAAGLSDREGMRRAAFAGFHLMLILAAITSSVLLLFGESIIQLFTSDPQLIAAAAAMIVPLVLYQFGDATQMNFVNALRGTANVMPMLWIAFVCYLIVGLPSTYILGFPAGLGAYGIILSFSVSLFLAAGMSLHYFLRATRR